MLKRIAFKDSKNAYTCLKCNTAITEIRNSKATCKECGLAQYIHEIKNKIVTTEVKHYEKLEKKKRKLGE